MEKGIVVGCDGVQEWLLPWWWENYRRANHFPVAFFDFGMSAKGRKWCLDKGILFKLDLAKGVIAAEREIAPEVAALWNSIYKDIWSSREAYFKKPLAIANCPFEIGIWLDLDCEVLGSLEPLFDERDPLSKIGAIRIGEEHQKFLCEKGLVRDEVIYTDGVVVFEREAPLIRLWAEAVIRENRHFSTDDHLLSHLIFKQRLPVREFSHKFHNMLSHGIVPDAVIVHWCGKEGKNFIRKYGGLASFNLQNGLGHYLCKELLNL